MHNLILHKDDISLISVDPAKTIFWIGAGVGYNAPCNLPLGNELTDAFLRLTLGDDYFEKFVLYWNNHIPMIKDCVRNGELHNPSKKRVYTIEEVRNDKVYDRPRLEFILGELNKLDHEFQRINFQDEDNKRRYSRKSSLKAIEHFSEAEPNYPHYWIADFVKRGAVAITANFDVCIEKALMGSENVPEPDDCDGVRGIVTDYGPVYHFHGIATDKDIDKNLGATINNVSKRLPEKFTEKVEGWLDNGYSIVFVGYSGLDFFDVQPFFESLGEDRKFLGKAIYLNFCSESECDDELAREKTYLYLIEPFLPDNQIIAYGDSVDFLKKLGNNSGVRCSIKPEDLSTETGKAFENTKDELMKLTAGKNDKDIDSYHFINLFRILSQLNISPSIFDDEWGVKICDIYFQWKNDSEDHGVLPQMFETKNQISESIAEDMRYNNWGSKNRQYCDVIKDISPLIWKWTERHGTPLMAHLSWRSKSVSEEILDSYVERTYEILKRGAYGGRTAEEEDIERDTVHYLCGWQTKKLYALWAIPIVRYFIRPKLQYLLDRICILTELPFTSLRYRTYYLSLCRQKGAIKAMLGDKGYDSNGYYGNIQDEWNICMETPNFYDARRIIHARKLQCWIMALKLNFRGFKKYGTLCRINKALEDMRKDQSAMR